MWGEGVMKASITLLDRGARERIIAAHLNRAKKFFLDVTGSLTGPGDRRVKDSFEMLWEADIE